MLIMLTASLEPRDCFKAVICSFSSLIFDKNAGSMCREFYIVKAFQRKFENIFRQLQWKCCFKNWLRPCDCLATVICIRSSLIFDKNISITCITGLKIKDWPLPSFKINLDDSKQNVILTKFMWSISNYGGQPDQSDIDKKHSHHV